MSATQVSGKPQPVYPHPFPCEFPDAGCVCEPSVPARKTPPARPERLATRYVCSNAGNEAAGLRHSSGNGKPSRKACAYCKGAFYVYTGLWGVFTWTGDGRYPEAAALATFTREALAQAYVDGENTRTDYAANLVLRWIYR